MKLQQLSAKVPDSLYPVGKGAYWQIMRTRNRLYSYVVNRGDQVECPCCHWHGQQFLPDGLGRYGVICPRCGSNERIRFLYLNQSIFDQLPKREAKILHFAPERLMEQLLRQYGPNRYVTTDLEKRDVDVKADIMDLPFRNGWFDLVVCSHVLEHVPDDLRAMREVRRILNEHGMAIFLVPVYDMSSGKTYENPSITSAADRLREYGQIDHARKYGLDFRERLESASFEVTMISPATWSREERKKYGILSTDGVRREDIYVCTKPT